MQKLVILATLAALSGLSGSVHAQTTGACRETCGPGLRACIQSGRPALRDCLRGCKTADTGTDTPCAEGSMLPACGAGDQAAPCVTLCRDARRKEIHACVRGATECNARCSAPPPPTPTATPRP